MLRKCLKLLSRHLVLQNFSVSDGRGRLQLTIRDQIQPGALCWHSDTNCMIHLLHHEGKSGLLYGGGGKMLT